MVQDDVLWNNHVAPNIKLNKALMLKCMNKEF